jgi:hypothetical protein
MKEDILEQLVDDWLQSRGYFTQHNLKFKPRPDRGIERVYLHRAPVDMRTQMDGLALLVQQSMSADAF